MKKYFFFICLMLFLSNKLFSQEKDTIRNYDGNSIRFELEGNTYVPLTERTIRYDKGIKLKIDLNISDDKTLYMGINLGLHFENRSGNNYWNKSSKINTIKSLGLNFIYIPLKFKKHFIKFEQEIVLYIPSDGYPSMDILPGLSYEYKFDKYFGIITGVRYGVIFKSPQLSLGVMLF